MNETSVLKIRPHGHLQQLPAVEKLGLLCDILHHPRQSLWDVAPIPQPSHPPTPRSPHLCVLYTTQSPGISNAPYTNVTISKTWPQCPERNGDTSEMLDSHPRLSFDSPQN